MAALRDLVRLGRPHFLVGGVAFHVLGLAVAAHAGYPVPLALAVVLQAFVTATQLGVHFGNEAHDLDADRANPTRTRFAGGSRVLLDGRVPAAVARNASWWAFGVAGLSMAVAAELVGLGTRQASWMLGLQVATVAMSFAYSAPPLRLHSRGIGELAAGLVVGGLVPLLPLVAVGAPVGGALWVVAPSVLQVAALVTVLSLPDQEGDASAGKRTLAVRVGPRATRRLVQAAWLACGLGSTAAVAFGAPPLFALAGGASFAAAVALPVLVLRRAWDLLALAAAGVVALQWVLAMTWAIT